MISMIIVNNTGLFPDAEVLEYIPQHFIRCNLSGDFAEVMEAFADVLGDKFTAKVRVQTGNDTFNSGAGAG